MYFPSLFACGQDGMLPLKTQLGATPVTAFRIPLDCIIRSHTDPVRQGPVCTLRFGKRALQSEALLR